MGMMIEDDFPTEAKTILYATGKERNKENCDGEIFNCQYPLTKQEHCAPVEEEECERWQKNNDCNDSK